MCGFDEEEVVRIGRSRGRRSHNQNMRKKSISLKKRGASFCLHSIVEKPCLAFEIVATCFAPTCLHPALKRLFTRKDLRVHVGS